jgi:hypothetical protein
MALCVSLTRIRPGDTPASRANCDASATAAGTGDTGRVDHPGSASSRRTRSCSADLEKNRYGLAPFGREGGFMSDLDARPLPPGRVEVAAQWHALAEGRVTREAMHAWAVPWVEGKGAFADFEDPLIVTALQYLHGFDLCQDPGRAGVVWHGTSPEGEWCHSLDDVRGKRSRACRSDGGGSSPARCRSHGPDASEGWIQAAVRSEPPAW